MSNGPFDIGEKVKIVNKYHPNNGTVAEVVGHEDWEYYDLQPVDAPDVLIKNVHVDKLVLV
jgi:hypothetical protein